MTVGEIIENLIYIKGTRELREWEVETINEACNALSRQKENPMTKIYLFNELEKAIDFVKWQRPNQNFEIRMTKKTFEKMRMFDVPQNIEEMPSGVLGL